MRANLPPSVLILFTIALAGIGGCRGGVRLAHPPNLYRTEGAAAFDRVPEAHRTRNPQVIYVTDREVTGQSDHGPIFGSDRSFDLKYGLATVDLGRGTWEDLVKSSTEGKFVKIPMSVGHVEPRGVVSFRPEDYEVQPDGSLDLSNAGRQNLKNDVGQFSQMLSQQLAVAGSGDVYVVVHGFSVTFPGSLFTTTHIWHHLGRPGVAIAYSWPAGHSGLLRGYTYDRESSEFTVRAFKGLLRAIAACPDVKRVHVIGHSRGTQVVADAVRELHLAYQAAGKQTYEEAKLETVVLAAPDMDWSVFRQRFLGDNATNAARRIVLYVSPDDQAIGMSDWLFSSGRRLGRLMSSDLSAHGRIILHATDRIQVINCKVSGFGSSHNYFYAHPAVLSDLILVLRDRRRPGAEHGRPLEPSETGIWQIGNDYPDPTKLTAAHPQPQSLQSEAPNASQ